MKIPSVRPFALLLLFPLTATGCGTPAPAPGPTPVQPGAPGEPSRPVSGAATASSAGVTAADVAFIRGMIPHHAQALEMAELVPERTDNRAIQLLSERIEVSQQDEIAMMERWLREHAASAAGGHDPHAAHGAGHALMPGMLTPEELAMLAATRGPEFDRLFLQFMIRHHEGALVMVEELFATPGAGQGGEIYQIASEIASDQRMEIDRMRRLLASF